MMQPVRDFEHEKTELQAVLASGIFERAPNLEHVLRYVCDRYFEGAPEQIKEYNIAVGALGRRAEFDQKRDSIVRVEAHKLRKRLREYYESEGATHSLRIDIPSGQYAPQFLRQLQPEPSLGVPPPVLDIAGPPVLPDALVPQQTVPEQTRALCPMPDPESLLPGQLLLPAPSSRGRYGLWIAVPVLALTFGGLFLWEALSAKPAKVSASPVAGIAAAPPHEIRILAGLKEDAYLDRFGRTWQSDAYFQGGSVFECAGHPIAATRDQRLFRSRRDGQFSYDIPLPPGVYELRLYFAETLYGENNIAGGGETSRVFNVYANGAQLLRGFDVIGEVGPSTADTRAFKDISPAADGKLHLRFEPENNNAIVSAIEITPGIPGKLVPIRMVSRERPYTDRQGRVWAADIYSRGGQLALRNQPVMNIDDPEMLHGERYGNLSYVIPVPPGRYGLKLFFAEAWFGPGNFAGGGTGSRIFDILCGGVAVRRGFDIFKEAHGSDRAIIVPVHGLKPDSQGKLTISLVPVRNYASLNALEVTDESK
jgi:hypothetical protein